MVLREAPTIARNAGRLDVLLERRHSRRRESLHTARVIANDHTLMIRTKLRHVQVKRKLALPVLEEGVYNAV